MHYARPQTQLKCYSCGSTRTKKEKKTMHVCEDTYKRKRVEHMCCPTRATVDGKNLA